MTTFYRPALFAAVTLMLLSAVPAYADWGFTHWGMSPEQVAQAGNGTVRATDLKEVEKRSAEASVLTALSAAPQSLEASRGMQYFLFDKANRLARVDIYFSLAKDDSLERTLSKMFGTPAAQKTSWAGKTFQWQTPNERIVLIEVDGRASITCTPNKI